MDTSAIIKNIDQLLSEKMFHEMLSPDDITPRELWIVQLFVRGYNQEEIGDKLHISPWTVDTHIKNI
jgi:DNA-binding NarL/FixJ family response regulator